MEWINVQEMKKDHPWGVFLNARKEAIIWMSEKMGYDDKNISDYLSTGPVQVNEIRTVELNKENSIS